MKSPLNSTVMEIIELPRLLGDFGQIERVTRLPNGRQESDPLGSNFMYSAVSDLQAPMQLSLVLI